MPQIHHKKGRFYGVQAGALGLFLLVTLLGATGLSCDDEASATFRQEATGAIGEGLKTMVNGVLDGFVAAIESAGDGSSSTSESSSGSSG